MIRKLLIVVWIIWGLPVARSYGQTSSYYSVRDPMHSITGSISSVYMDTAAGVFYTLGPCWDSVNIVSPGWAYPAFGVRFTRWSLSTGQKLAEKTTQQGLLDTTSGNTRTYFLYQENTANLIRLESNKFITVFTTVDTGSIRRIGLLCVDSNGNKLWMKEYDKPSCNYRGESFSPNRIRKTSTGEWIILARNTCSRTISWGDVVFMKLDSSFNLKWTKLFPIPSGYDFYPDCLLTEPDGYVAGYSLYRGLNDWYNPSEDRNKLMKVDTAGNVLWTWTSDIQDHESWITDIVHTADGGYLYSCVGEGTLHQAGTPGASYKMHGMLQKLDSLRQPVWRFVDTSTYEPFRSILAMGNGSYLTTIQRWAGHVGGDTNSLNGALYQISSNGQMLWRRHYTGDSSRQLWEKLYHMAMGKNRDVVLVGMSQAVAPYDTLQSRQRGWVVKVDSNGCLGPNDPQCIAGMGIEEVSYAEQAVQVYPNPTTGLVRITTVAAASIRVQDLAGRVVYSGSLRSGEQELNLSSLPSGMYLYRIESENGTFQSGKLLKQ